MNREAACRSQGKMRRSATLSAATIAALAGLAAAQTDVTIAPTNWTTEGGSVWREGTIAYDGSGKRNLRRRSPRSPPPRLHVQAQLLCAAAAAAQHGRGAPPRAPRAANAVAARHCRFGLLFLLAAASAAAAAAAAARRRRFRAAPPLPRSAAAAAPARRCRARAPLPGLPRPCAADAAALHSYASAARERGSATPARLRRARAVAAVPAGRAAPSRRRIRARCRRMLQL